MIKSLIAVLVAIAAGSYYFFYYPPVVLKRATGDALEQFSASVATKDRAQVAEALRALLSEDAAIRLEVNFFTLPGQGRPALTERFDKRTFIAFIDNTLYPLADYEYMSHLEEFVLADDKQSAQVVFSSKEWADGNSYYGGAAIMTRFSSQTRCEGEVTFAADAPQLTQADCVMQFRSVPKPGEAQRLNNMKDLKERLFQQP